MSNLVYKYKLKPTPAQAEAIDRTLETLRRLYNRALQERITAYQVHGRTLTAYDQSKTLITEDRRFNPDLAAVNVGVAKDCLLRLDKTYQNFFRRVKAGTEAPGFPKARRFGEYNTFSHAMLGNGCKWLGEQGIYLQNIGIEEMFYYREIPVGAIVKNLSITRQADGYWVCALLSMPDVEPPENTLPAVGIDVGYGWAFVMTSNGECFAPERYYIDSLDTLANSQRYQDQDGVKQQTFWERGRFRVKRYETPLTLKRGGCDQREIKRQIARLHLHIRNRRKEWHIAVANALLSKYGTIYHEKLNIRDMVERPEPREGEEGEYLPNGADATTPMRRNTLDMAWGQFFTILGQQAPKVGGRAIGVPAEKTTQTCAECGRVNTVLVKLSDREFHCRHCQHRQDRKHNSARVILARGSQQNA